MNLFGIWWVWNVFGAVLWKYPFGNWINGSVLEIIERSHQHTMKSMGGDDILQEWVEKNDKKTKDKTPGSTSTETPHLCLRFPLPPGVMMRQTSSCGCQFSRQSSGYCLWSPTGESEENPKCRRDPQMQYWSPLCEPLPMISSTSSYAVSPLLLLSQQAFLTEAMGAQLSLDFLVQLNRIVAPVPSQTPLLPEPCLDLCFPPRISLLSPTHHTRPFPRASAVVLPEDPSLASIVGSWLTWLVAWWAPNLGRLAGWRLREDWQHESKGWTLAESLLAQGRSVFVLLRPSTTHIMQGVLPFPRLKNNFVLIRKYFEQSTKETVSNTNDVTNVISTF